MAEPMKLGLKALAAGVDHIPNEYWEKLPPFKHKEAQKIQEAEKMEEKHSRKPRDHHRDRRPKPRRNSTGTALAAGGAGAALGAGAGYEGNRRRRHGSHDDDNDNDDDSNAEHNTQNKSSPMPDDNYTQNTYQPPRDGNDSRYDNYSYQPNQYVPPGYGAGDVARRQPSEGPQSRNDRSSQYEQDNYSSDDDERQKRRSHRSSRRARSPDVGGMRGKMSKNLDFSEKGLGYGVLGAIAGGFIGREFGKGPIATGVGAVVGGLGANVLEAREERHKLNARREAKYAGRRSRSENRKHSSSYDDSRQSYYNDSYYNNGRGYEASDDEYDDRSNRRSRTDSSRR